MAVDRVHSSNSRIYVNNTLLTGISNCEITNPVANEPIQELGSYVISDRVAKSKQSPEISLSWVLGAKSSDPFFDFATSGIISVESFNIKVRDTVGEQILSGAVLNSYSVKAGVGELVTATAKYE